MTNTMFMHYRLRDKNGNIAGNGGLTLAVQDLGDRIRIAEARCGRKDIFCRRLGRTIAEGRLRAGAGRHVLDLARPDPASGQTIKGYVHRHLSVQRLLEQAGFDLNARRGINQ